MCAEAKYHEKKKWNGFQKRRRILRFYERVVISYRQNYVAALNVVILYYICSERISVPIIYFSVYEVTSR